MKKLTALVLFSFLAAASVRATVIWQELFPYANGYSVTVSTNLWLLHSGNPDSFVNNNQLEVCSSTVFQGVTVTRTGDVHRFLSVTNNSAFTNSLQPFYASFMMTMTNQPLTQGSYFAHFFVNNITFFGRLWALQGNAGQPTNSFNSLPSCFHLGVSGISGARPYGSAANNNGDYPLDLALNSQYQVVLYWDPLVNNNVTVWVNPTSSSDLSVASGGVGDTISSATLSNPTNFVTGFAFRQASGFGGFVQVSNVVIATTFNDAALTVASTNAVAPSIVIQPAAVTSNFINSAFSVFGVANGQGLGSMVYKWQVSSSPANTSPANVSGVEFSGVSSNVLTLNPAHVADSGYYTLVATTPYGLSATSSVAKIAISSANVPPVFTVQPVSQTIYRGQQAIFSTTVSSPGNISYTWFSNNVAVSSTANNNGNQADAGESSTYTLSAATTNASANYKVAVTNDTVANGVVSSNAVLTVLNPIKTNIAYLRHLVDPVTYQSTNSTSPASAIPYEVIGTVTTYTNITTGNTASYYLQDATAGINIFVTGGSTFRPASGDIVDFVGILSSFSTGLELYADTFDNQYPQTSFTDTGATNALPAPMLIDYNILTSPSNANYNLGGLFAQISNVVFGANSGHVTSTSANDFVGVTGPGGQQFNLMFPNLDLDVAGRTLPSTAFKVSGIVYSTGGIVTNVLVVTRWADVVTSLPTPIPVNMSYNPANGNITFTWTDSSFSLQTSTNVNMAGSWTTVPGASSPFTTNTTSGPTRFYRLFNPDP